MIMMSFDLNILLGIIYVALVYVAITAIYVLIVTDYFMRLWKSKQISGMRRVLLVIAHPDDECMFFGPTIVALSKAADVRVYVLCLSSGNHDGLGAVRKLELWHSCKKLGISEGNVTCLNHHLMQDGPEVNWQTAHMSKVLLHHIKGLDIDTILTFDDYGVSGHLNHISIYNCFLELREKNQMPAGCRIFSLESVSWFRKYILGVFDVYLSYLTSSFMYVTNEGGRSIIRSAMEVHASQYVWYRKLYMVFSRYVNVNTFKEVKFSASSNNANALKRRKFPLFRSTQSSSSQPRPNVKSE